MAIMKKISAPITKIFKRGKKQPLQVEQPVQVEKEIDEKGEKESKLEDVEEKDSENDK